MSFASMQHGFSSGEMSPRLFGRTDLAKYALGCSTMRNFFCDYRGGASSRAGLAYIGMCKQGAPNDGGTVTDNPPRDIQFQFSIEQGYALEFGDQYMRIKSDGAYVVEVAKTITAATNANPVVITSNAHGFSNGDWIHITNMAGMTELNGLTWIVANKTANTFELTDLFDNTVTSVAFGVYTSGGAASRIYTVISPYAAIDLPFLKFTQSADTMTLGCINQKTSTEYPSYELTRNAATDWTFTVDSFNSSISPPTGVTVVAHNSTTLSTYYSYVVTAIDNDTGEESVASSVGTVQNNNIAINAGSNMISWNSVLNASNYNVYASTPSFGVAVPIGASFGYLGTAFGTQFTDTNITADFTTVPPIHRNPFARGAIAAVTVLSGGSTMSQATINYNIITSTGGGFIGSPIVVNALFSGFHIDNGGSNYAPTDTITITSTTGVLASGAYTFTTNPISGQTIILNGITWTFTGGSTGTKTEIGIDLATTLAILAANLNLSTDPAISVASYSANATVLTITYKIPGTAGNAYTLAAGTYGGTVSGATLSGGSAGGASTATASLVVGPQSGTYPGVCSYFQQRRVYAYTLNNPDMYFMSQPGAFNNMDSSIPSTDSDAITGAPWAQQINGIQSLVPMPGGLIILTGEGAWQVNGSPNGTNVAITPSDQVATPQAYNGGHFHIQPIVVNYDILYVQAKGSVVRDLSYNFYINIYTGNDLTVLSEHLFNFHQIVQWAYAEEPYKLVWCVRADGIMLCLTYLKEQDVYGWSRHDTNGLFVGVCSVVEPPVDAVYTLVKRYITGESAWAYYAERMDNRNWQNVEDSFCVDAGLALTATYPNATLTPSSTDGTNNISSININIEGSGYVSPTISAVDPTGEGSGFAATLTVTSGAITGYSITNQGVDYQPGTQLVVSDSTGTGAVLAPALTNYVTFTVSSSVFTASNIGDVIRIGNNNAAPSTDSVIVPNGEGKAIIISQTGTACVANIIQSITNVIPNDPNNMPAPVSANYWSVTAPVSSVSGLNHLEGMEVAILADGSVIANQTVTDGAITLPAEYSSIKIGLPYLPQLQTLYLEVPSQTGTVQGKQKNIQAVTARVQNTRGFSVGTNQPDASASPNGQAPAWERLYEMKQRNVTNPPGTAVPLFTGDLRELVAGSWEKPGQIAVQVNYPLPVNILALIPEFTLGDN